MTKKGFAIHCHHDILVEYCYNYDERVTAIKNTKPKNEIETRLRLFKLLPEEALKDIPIRLQKAYAEREKAYAEWEKAGAEWKKAYAEWKKADDEWKKAYAEWPQKDKDIFHQKYCGCSEWNGTEIVFSEKAQ